MTKRRIWKCSVCACVIQRHQWSVKCNGCRDWCHLLRCSGLSSIKNYTVKFRTSCCQSQHAPSVGVPSLRAIQPQVTVRKNRRLQPSEIHSHSLSLLQNAIHSCDESHLRVKHYEKKGRGIYSSKKFNRGDFVVEYKGDLIDGTEAADRERKYTEDYEPGCYMYYFKYANRKYCVDATQESSYKGRLINHSALAPNLKATCVKLDGEVLPHLILIATKSISPGEELLYDYGERNKAVLASNQWLVKS